jgi:hypothetical protein
MLRTPLSHDRGRVNAVVVAGEVRTLAADERHQRPAVGPWLLLRLPWLACPGHRMRHRAR